MKFIKILLFLLMSVLLHSCISCSSDNEQDSDSKMKIEQQNFSLNEWVNIQLKCYSISPQKRAVIQNTFSAFEDKVVTFLSENLDYSTDFIDDEDDFQDFINLVWVGPISLKSLEQTINIEIDLYNNKNMDNRLGRVVLNYIKKEQILPTSSRQNIQLKFEEIDNLDIKKKIRKEKYWKAITNEILKNYSIELEKQKLFSQIFN